ncbi:MAG: DUF2384 domain-containing protein [Ekhidna sp.]|nr:DUF2384 domain-containing protein [Ekhidna sp.]MBC6410656.1 DUF2384 domain-containing protein [Ekhidna sp.]MBC6426639.1 DUF2384 domain-containing protein [Ekhidna sp.]
METINIQKQLSEELTSFLENTKAYEHVNIPDKIDYSDFLKSKMLIVFAIRSGLPYSIFNLIQSYSPFSLQEWSGFLNISYKSLQRYKAMNTRFKPLYTEKIFELAEILDTGVEVFGDFEKLKLWLTAENYALGNLKPIELLRDSYGKDLVLAELTRIDHGILV